MRSEHRISRAIAGAACLSAATLAAIWARQGGESAPDVRTSANSASTEGPAASDGDRAAGLKGGSAEAFEKIRQELTEVSQPDGPPRALAMPASKIAEALANIAASYDKLSLLHRTQALALVPLALQRLANRDVGEDWESALAPIEALTKAGFADRLDPARANAAAATIRVWGLLPGRSIAEIEENRLNEWKSRLQELTIKALNDPNPVVRAAAVASLGANPTESGSMPALTRLNDDEAAVRAQVILSFGDREEALPIDAIVPRLNDRDAEVKRLAEKALKRRGLDARQLELARLVSHDDPRARASAIDRLALMGLSPSELGASASSIDPETWMLHLSEDADASVRTRALEGLARMATPAARNRIEEMAAIDPTSSVRVAARRLAPDSGPATVGRDLPPLPDADAIPASASSSDVSDGARTGKGK